MYLINWLRFKAAHPLVQKVINNPSTADTLAFGATKLFIIIGGM